MCKDVLIKISYLKNIYRAASILSGCEGAEGRGVRVAAAAAGRRWRRHQRGRRCRLQHQCRLRPRGHRPRRILQRGRWLRRPQHQRRAPQRRHPTAGGGRAQWRLWWVRRRRRYIQRQRASRHRRYWRCLTQLAKALLITQQLVLAHFFSVSTSMQNKLRQMNIAITTIVNNFLIYCSKKVWCIKIVAVIYIWKTEVE